MYKYAVLSTILMLSLNANSGGVPLNDVNDCFSLLTPTSNGILMKESLFVNLPAKNSTVSALNSSVSIREFDYQLITPTPPGDSVLTRLLKKAESQFSTEDMKRFRAWLFSHFAIDRQDLLHERLLTPDAADPAQYAESQQDYLLGYMLARDAAHEMTLDELLTIEGLEKINRLVLSANNGDEIRNRYGRESFANYEDVGSEEIGSIRSQWVGHAIRKSMMPSKIEVTDPLGHLIAPVQSWEELFVSNPYLSKRGRSISYADLSQWRKLELHLSSELRHELEKAEADKVITKECVSRRCKALLKKFITHLTQDAIHHFRPAPDKEGLENNSEKLLDSAGELYWNLVSIHPFTDGNGRTMRILLERILHQYRFRSPMWTYMDEDCFQKPAIFNAILRNSLNLSKRFLEEVDLFIIGQKQFDIQKMNQRFINYLMPYSMILQIPSIALKDTQFISGDEYREFASLKELDPNDFDTFELYTKWLSQIHRAKDDRMRGIRLIPSEYVDSFNRLSRTELEYNEKLKRFYKYDQGQDSQSVDENIYRGSAGPGVASIPQIIKVFTGISDATAAPGVDLNQRSVVAAMDYYNRLALKPNAFLKELNDHTRERPSYWTSIFSSFTSNENLAKNFANSDYLEKNQPGVVSFVSALRPSPAIYTNAVYFQFNQNSPFSYEFEFNVIGALDPEAVNEVIFIELKGPSINSHSNFLEHYSRGKILKAKRLSWNKILVTESAIDRKISFTASLSFNGMMSLASEPQKSYTIEIYPNRSYKIIAESSLIPASDAND